MKSVSYHRVPKQKECEDVSIGHNLALSNIGVYDVS